MRTTTARALAWSSAALLVMGFGTPLIALWAQPSAPWWTAYALWGAAIAAIAGAARGIPRDHADPPDLRDLHEDAREHPEPRA
jgi:hypothetical protein